MKSAANKAENTISEGASASAEPPDAGADKKAEERSSFLDQIRCWLRSALRQKDSSLKEVLEEVIEEHEEQAEERLAPEEKLMLHNVLRFSEIKVSDIMTPRADIAAVACEITWPELRKHIVEMRHTRVPVYEETLDNVKGFIHIKDLLELISEEKELDINSMLRTLLFVPPSMRIIDLLIRMRHAGSHMAIVVDEYGGTDGLVTMEDLFEEIVGDIQDEHDEDEAGEFRIHKINDATYEVSARIPIESLEKQLGVVLSAEEDRDEFDTLGGLIFFQLGRVPVKGEIVQHESGIHFEIADADPRRIRRVRILTATSRR